MRRRMAVVAVAAGAVAALGGTTAALAGDVWCEVDPGVPVRTPAGNTVVVFLVNGGPTSHRSDLAHPAHSHTVEAVAADDPAYAGGARTRVTMTVTIGTYHGDAHTATSRIWEKGNQGGALYSDLSGPIGQATVHTFTLTTP